MLKSIRKKDLMIVCVIFSVSHLSCTSSFTELSNTEPFQLRILDPVTLKVEERLKDSRVYRLETDKVRNRIIEAKVPGYEPVQYLVLDSGSGDIMKIQVNPSTRLSEKSDIEQSLASRQIDQNKDPNTKYRLILEAYQAVISENLEKARGISEQLVVMLPEVAAPYVIQGLIAIQSGDYSLANRHLAKARTLDPNDANIKELIEFVESNTN